MLDLSQAWRFTYEACLRQRFHDNGRFSDDWFFSLLAHEFYP